jgi:ankyrin repeat protein
MSGIEVAALALSYAASIVTLSSLLRRREKGSKISSTLLKDAEESAERLETILDEVLKRENIESSTLKQLQELSRSLPKIRDSLSEYKNRRDLRNAVNALQDFERELTQIIAQDQNTLESGQEPGDDFVKSAIRPPEIVVAEEHFNPSQLSHAEPALHLIYRPDNTPASNIVFVHGLNGNAEKTWTGSGDDRVFWPRDLLAQDVRHSAIWIYSYDSRIDMSGKSKEPLAHVFRRIGNELRLSLQAQTHGPLIWVAHSLGGLLVKTALTLSNTETEVDPDDEADTRSLIASRTRGIIFMGTPHAGSSPGARAARFTTILSVFSRHPTAIRYESEIGELRLDSTITRTTSDFAALLDRKGFPVVSLFESQPMLTDSGPRMVVDEFARLNHPNETTGILEGNHLTMCKFEAKEERGYALVLKAIMSFQQSLSFERLSLVSSHQPPNSAPSKATSISDADAIDIGTLYARLRLKFDVPVSRWTSVKLRDYEDGSWFPSSDAFDRWFKGSKNAPLLIQGPVGCGKTMIAESILENLRHRAVRQHLSHSICHLHLFFRSDQVAYQLPLAILAALIAQTLDHDNSLVRHFRKVPPRFENMTVISQALLKGTLRQMLEDSCWQEIYLVVDALDECQAPFVQSSFEIISWILEIQKLHSVFTNSTGNNSDGTFPAIESSSQNADLASVLRMALPRENQDFDVVDLRSYKPWIDNLAAYTSGRLGLRLGLKKGRNVSKTNPITSLPIKYRYRLKHALLSLPHLSFSVVDLVLQDFNYGTNSAYQDQPLKLWFDEKLSQLGDITMMYNALIELAYRQSRTCVRILSLLSCVREPLRLPEFCSLWEHGLGPSVRDPDQILLPEQLYDIVTSGEMPLVVTVDGDGLHLSSDMVRQAIRRQMKQAQASETYSNGENRLGHVFEEYERFNCQIARSCLLILQQNRWLPGKIYAEKHWASHLRQAGSLAMELNALVKQYYQQQSSPAASPVQEPHDAHQSKIFRRLAEDSLSVNLGSIFGAAAEDIEFPDPRDIDAALKDPPSQETLVELQKINSRSNFQELEKEERNSKLDIVMAIQKRDIETLQIKMKDRDFTLDDRMYFLRLAIDVPNVEAVGLILQHFERASLVPDHPSRELLTRAVRYQNRDLVQSMLRYRYLFDMSSALIAAVEASNIGLCEDLLTCGADAGVLSKSGETVLHIAAATNSADLVALLLRWNAAVNAVDANNRTALHLAAERGYTDVAQVLLKNSASLTARDQSGRSSFFAACAEGRRDVARLLWFSGADLQERDASGRSVLHAAASSGHEEIFGMLLSAGMTVEPRDHSGITPLQEAAEQGWALIVERLLDLGANVETKCTGDASALHFACTATNAPEAVVQLLLQRGADPCVRDVLGRTPLLLAVQLSTVRVVKILVKLDRSILRDTDNQGRGVYDYLHATGPLDSIPRKLTPKERLEQSNRNANRSEKLDFLRMALPGSGQRHKEDGWKATGIRVMAEEQRAEEERAEEERAKATS